MKVKRYSDFINSNGKDFSLGLPKVFYDDIVDRSNFHPDEDLLRSVSKGQISMNVGSYDYDSDKVPFSDKDTVSPVIVALRNNKLDKADVQKLKQDMEKLSKDESSSALEKKNLEKLDKINKSRQDYLDSVMGFDSSAVDTEKK